MTYDMKKINKILTIAVIALGFSTPALAQLMGTNGWSPQLQNRASIAALLQQVEENGSSGSSSSPAATSGVTLVCGDGGDATAKGNSSCIILNNSTGVIDLGQDSNGDQSATFNN